MAYEDEAKDIDDENAESSSDDAAEEVEAENASTTSNESSLEVRRAIEEHLERTRLQKELDYLFDEKFTDDLGEE